MSGIEVEKYYKKLKRRLTKWQLLKTYSKNLSLI